jgi:hypothetical protein
MNLISVALPALVGVTYGLPFSEGFKDLGETPFEVLGRGICSSMGVAVSSKTSSCEIKEHVSE